MKITKKPNINKFLKKIENSKDKVALMGHEVIATITNRTRKGIDYNENQFKKYSKQYSKQKIKDGYGSSTVNLTRDSNMLNSIRFRKTSKGIRVYFGNKDENKKAYYNQSIYNRKFFGLTEKEKKYFVKKLKRLIFT